MDASQKYTYCISNLIFSQRAQNCRFFNQRFITVLKATQYWTLYLLCLLVAMSYFHLTLFLSSDLFSANFPINCFLIFLFFSYVLPVRSIMSSFFDNHPKADTTAPPHSLLLPQSLSASRCAPSLHKHGTDITELVRVIHADWP